MQYAVCLVTYIAHILLKISYRRNYIFSKCNITKITEKNLPKNEHFKYYLFNTHTITDTLDVNLFCIIKRTIKLTANWFLKTNNDSINRYLREFSLLKFFGDTVRVTRKIGVHFPWFQLRRLRFYHIHSRGSNHGGPIQRRFCFQFTALQFQIFSAART